MDAIKEYHSFVIVIVVFSLSMIILTIIRTVVFSFLGKWAKKTSIIIDDIIIATLKKPSIFIVIAISILIAMQYVSVSHTIQLVVNKVVNTIIIFAVTLGVANIIGAALQKYVKDANIPLAPTGLTYVIIKGLVILIGVLIILNYLGISIAPILTTLGVGGLAVALALQDTLSNLFAGMQILIERSVRVGDFIKIEEGIEGYVEDITWRTTRIRMLPNNIVIIPNSKLAQSMITNFYLPIPHLAVRIPVSVSYGSDPQHVEETILDEVISAAYDIKELILEPEPVVRFIPGFGDSSLDFTLIVYVKEYADQFPVESELRKRIFNRFKKEGIEIPFPQRVIHIAKE
ncbi:MAG: mechanosensitive ion channel family protein [Spirochaetes bacterium]|nr:mechanosensitive ion channel family protein [Spirochaetota bacterium]